MFITIHAAVAVALTQQVSSPLLAGAIGFASHLALDAVPHGDDAVYDRCAARGWSRLKFGLVFGVPDSLAWLGLVAWIVLSGAAASNPIAVAAAVGAALPDIMWGLSTLLPKIRWLAAFDRLHTRTHHLLGRCLVHPWIGYSIQLATFVVALVWLLR